MWYYVCMAGDDCITVSPGGVIERNGVNFLVLVREVVGGHEVGLHRIPEGMAGPVEYGFNRNNCRWSFIPNGGSTTVMLKRKPVSLSFR